MLTNGVVTGFTLSGVNSIAVVGGGSGYSSATPPLVSFSGGGGGSGATATAVVNSNSVVTSIIITNPGSGYTSAPTVTIAAPAAGTMATATATIDSAGSGYTAVPSVTIANPERTGALSVSYSSPGTTGKVTFTPVAGVSDAATITITVTDQGSNSNGSVNFTQQSFVVAVAPSHFPPVLTPATGGTLTFFQGQAATPIAPSLTVTDTENSPPDTTIASASVAFVNNTYLPGEDFLGFSPNPQNGITGVFNAQTGILNLTGVSSLANYQAALNCGHIPGHQQQPESRGYGTGPHRDVHGQ